ncbi:Zinc finger C2H2 [Penicillium cf. griseofulvum]|uniref:Zinc finger C2H2 n=1 Tax=Penicillium cf. griseofulvum TaxID=2972120 RepID=A0A9W9MRF8_9EURO|nr:Zinc finger C2H2 [Penicillium cf. griseofulvum]KAJ5440891.1 Zinc finger C2H2 [Penicillium cf. griseofulvum]KAJ5448936.1 Zinc finger C2H2 [Penicillium cf. griseofulvum]
MSTSQNPSAEATPAIHTPTPSGSYWRSYGTGQPQVWAEPPKMLCDCGTHGAWRWPTQYAEITIAPCAHRCPFCDRFNKARKTTHMASNLRRHIKTTHIQGNPTQYGTLVVTSGVTQNQIDIPRST